MVTKLCHSEIEKKKGIDSLAREQAKMFSNFKKRDLDFIFFKRVFMVNIVKNRNSLLKEEKFTMMLDGYLNINIL